MRQRQTPGAALLQSAALGLARPFDAETVSQTDVQDPVRLVVFLEVVRRQCQCKWRAPDFILDPVAGYVN